MATNLDKFCGTGMTYRDWKLSIFQVRAGSEQRLHTSHEENFLITIQRTAVYLHRYTGCGLKNDPTPKM